MFVTIEESDRIEMSRTERDRLKVLYGVIQGERSQKEAARLLRLTERQVRRLLRRIEQGGDQGLIHRLRGQPSNHRLGPELRQEVLRWRIREAWISKWESGPMNAKTNEVFIESCELTHEGAELVG